MKKDTRYCKRRLVEIAISVAFKRKYADSVMATKMENIGQVAKQKICIYNDMHRVRQESVMRAYAVHGIYIKTITKYAQCDYF